MKYKSIVLGVKLAMLAFVVSEAYQATTHSPFRRTPELQNRMLVYGNSTPRIALPDLPNFAAWSAFLEKALRDEAYRRDSVGIADARIEVYAANDSAVTLQVNHLYRLLDSMNLQYRVNNRTLMGRGVTRGMTVQFDRGLKPQAYFDLRDHLLQWRNANQNAPIQVQVQETPYTPRTGIDSSLQFVAQLNAMPLKDKVAIENYASRQVLPQMRSIENLRYIQPGISVSLQIGRLLTDAEIQAENRQANRVEIPGIFKFFNRDLPFMQRMGQFEIMAWVALGLGLINSLTLLLFLFRWWRSRRIS